MARYTVHVPEDAGRDAAALERAVFVRDGWSWGAFLFGPLWLMWKRHWLIGLAVLVIELAGLRALDTLAVPFVAGTISYGLIALLLGFEGASLRRFALSKAGFAEVALVTGSSLDDLERRFFDSVTPEQPAVPVSASVVPQISTSGVIGSFPQARM